MRPWEGTPVQVHVCQVAVEAPPDTENISLTVGEGFTVVLASPDSDAGYDWSLAQSLPSWLELVGTTNVPTNPGLIGTGYTEYWVFQATGAGSTTLTFQYMRPWIGTPTQVHVCQVTAQVAAEPEVISVAVGEEFTVNLTLNPSTGYDWSLAVTLPSWLALVDKQEAAWNSTPGIVGSPVTEYWTFRATGSGSTTLTFQYMRSWEGTPAKVHVCQVTAETQEPNMDGFETGDFSVLAWGHQDTPWQITSIQPFSGTSCSGPGRSATMEYPP